MPPRSAAPTPPDPSDDTNIEQSLQKLEQSLLRLKARYAQVQLDRQRQAELQQRLSQAQRDAKRRRSQELQSELKALQQQLDEVELALESQLFSWRGLQDVFWQAVRFGGLGVIVGWMLKTWAGS
ncbi:MAG: DUF2203 domain-containing protein [Synechococcales cyanobacterium C42_A2020_086]|jgi:ABC-type phosphate transport system auxiliary subunit|nr:DUF2203 domain-containing protein [Synechococcales cyanobacterium C42_A2020_086]